MNLTIYHKNAFVRAALNDVPQVDYRTKIDDLAKKLATEALPLHVQLAYKNSETAAFINREQIFIGEITRKHAKYGQVMHSLYITVPCPNGHRDWAQKVVDTPEMRTLVAAFDAQHIKFAELEEKLEATIKGIRTRKRLIEVLPEFEKYLPPAEPEAERQLPVIANLVADFIKAGWPKAAAEAQAKKLEEAKASLKKNRAKHSKKVAA